MITKSLTFSLLSYFQKRLTQELKMKFSKITLQGALNQDKARACERYASALPRDAPVAIVDGGADYSILGKGFMITSKIDDHDGSFTLNTPFSGTREEVERGSGIATYVDYDGKARALVQVHQGCIAKNPGLESLLASDQLEWNGIKVLDRPIAFGGQQCLQSKSWTIPLLWDGKTKFFRLRRPTKKDLKTLPIWNLTSKKDYSPESLLRSVINGNTNQQPNDNQDYVVRRIQWTDEKIQEWKIRLGCVNTKTVKKTFENTTQNTPSISCENQENPQMHFQTRFPWTRPRYLNDKVFCDTIYFDPHKGDKSRCGQLFICQKSKYMAFYKLNREGECVEALKQFMTDVGRPTMIVSDSAQAENKSEKWKKYLRTFFIKTHETEANYQHQNLAERYVQVLKTKAGNLRYRYQTSTSQYDNYLFKYVCELHNVTVNKTLNYTTPHKKLWGKPQIHLIFKWWDQFGT